MTPAAPPLITHVYFTIGVNANPSQLIAGGISMITGYVPWWSKHGIRLHVVMAGASDQEPGEEEINGVIWHRFVKGQVISPSAIVTDEAIEHALRLIQRSVRNDTEASLLMPCDHSTPDSPGLLAKARRMGIASLLPVHMCLEPPRPWSIRDRVRAIRDRRWLRSYTAAHANSEVSGEAMSKAAGMPRHWAKVIVNGVNTTRFRPPASEEEKRETRRRLGLPEDGFMGLFVGGATQRKGVDFLFDAWERFVREHAPGGTLVLIGGTNRGGTIGPSARFADLFNRRLNELRRLTTVIHIDHVSDLQEHYRSADVFTFASRQEGLPNAVLEAMSSGLPVVCTRFIGFPHEGGEFGYDGQHFLSLPRDTSAWSSALHALAGDSQRRARIGSAARRWMQSYQDIEMVTAQSAEFFHALARHGAACLA